MGRPSPSSVWPAAVPRFREAAHLPGAPGVPFRAPPPPAWRSAARWALRCLRAARRALSSPMGYLPFDMTLSCWLSGRLPAALAAGDAGPPTLRLDHGGLESRPAPVRGLAH